MQVDYLTEVLPPLLVFALGLSMTVAPLTAAVLAGAEQEAGIASGVNNAIARVAGLLGTAAVGAAIAASFASSMRPSGRRRPRRRRAGGARRSKAAAAGTPRCPRSARRQAHAISTAAEAASLHCFHLGMAVAAALVALGGLIGAGGIRNPKLDITAEDGGGGQFAAANRSRAASAA